MNLVQQYESVNMRARCFTKRSYFLHLHSIKALEQFPVLLVSSSLGICRCLKMKIVSCMTVFPTLLKQPRNTL